MLAKFLEAQRLGHSWWRLASQANNDLGEGNLTELDKTVNNRLSAGTKRCAADWRLIRVLLYYWYFFICHLAPLAVASCAVHSERRDITNDWADINVNSLM